MTVELKGADDRIRVLEAERDLAARFAMTLALEEGQLIAGAEATTKRLAEAEHLLQEWSEGHYWEPDRLRESTGRFLANSLRKRGRSIGTSAQNALAMKQTR